MTRTLIKGNEAITEAALAAGCRFYAGYPITPQNEITSSMARRMPEEGGVFIQAESEIAAINLCFGASVAGARAMTSTSSPGFSLMQEAVSYLAACEISCVLVNVMRGGPGLGNIQPSQSDYFQAVKGGGHGDYHCLVLAPATVEEAYAFTQMAFDLADKYRNPVLVLADGLLGQVMEPVDLAPAKPLSIPARDWKLDGAKGRQPRKIRSLLMDDGVLEKHNYKLAKKYRSMAGEVRWESDPQEGAELLVVGYGSAARAAKAAVREAREKGMKAEWFRPQTLWPFPSEALREAAQRAGKVLVVEMSLGQMVEDVRLAVDGSVPVEFFGRPGGAVLSPREILEAMERVVGKKVKAFADSHIQKTGLDIGTIPTSFKDISKGRSV
jgi:2-oxoglutarate ferredoxin oxidoreductase subunit alpha